MKENNFTLKNNLLKLKILTSFLIVFSITAKAQTYNYKELILTDPICVYKEDLKNYKTKGSFLRKKVNLSSSKTSTFVVTYNGFTNEARLAFQHAVDIWERILVSSVPIRVDATFTALEGSTLGSAGTASLRTISGFAGIDPNTWYPAALFEKLLGEDRDGPSGRSNDINARFNSSFDWYFGTDGNPPSNQSDFVTVVLHELAHGLGFVGFARTEGLEGLIRANDRALGYDSFVVNGDGVSILDFEDPSKGLFGQFVSNNLFSNSPLAILENNDLPPKIHAPSPFNRGSSYSHWDEDTFRRGDVNSLMSPQIARGEAIHDPGPITIALFKDMGWSINSSVLSTDDIAISTDVTIWPNPFNDHISINFSNLNSGKLKVKLLDIKGRLLFTKQFDYDGSNSILLNNVGDLGSGIYFITILHSESNRRITRKIVKY